MSWEKTPKISAQNRGIAPSRSQAPLQGSVGKQLSVVSEEKLLSIKGKGLVNPARTGDQQGKADKWVHGFPGQKELLSREL